MTSTEKATDKRRMCIRALPDTFDAKTMWDQYLLPTFCIKLSRVGGYLTWKAEAAVLMTDIDRRYVQQLENRTG